VHSQGVARLSFRLSMEQAAKGKGSNIVLALDLPPSKSEELLRAAQEILRAVHDDVCALKINRQLVLPLGLFGDLQKLLKQAQDYGLPTIMDCKINDIGNTNRIIAEYYFKAGFNAVTANPFVGWKDGLESVFETAKHMDRGVIVLVYMSHKGAWEGYGQETFEGKTGKPVPQYRVFAQKALEWGADGAVVGATYPEKIREVYSILEDKVPIYAPGIGAQGGKIETTVRSKASYLIVGRAITLADDPARAAKNFELAARASLNDAN
jgi:orotidine-5'-phosphate decarboxylase